MTRAELCISCHLGSDRHGRIITHEMYAAGHPPLAGFELESFADAMPRHWRYVREKPGSDGPDFQRTRNILTAAVVAMRMAVEVAAADAAAPQQAARWPEFARLDCFACHHELQSPSHRPLHQSFGPPGRPALIAGCLPLVRIAANVAGEPQAEEQLGALVKQLQAPFEQDPFGDPALLAPTNSNVSEWCRSIERRLEAIDVTPAQARAVLRRITEQAANHNLDYDTARQLLGAWVIVYGELAAAGELQLGEADRRPVEDILDSVVEQYPQMAPRNSLSVDCGTPPPEKHDFNEFLAQQFKNRVEYDPLRFKELMTQLARTLPE